MPRFSRSIVSVVFAVMSIWDNGAFAHAHLKMAEPAPKAELQASPQAVHIEFSEQVEAKFSRVVVKSAAGQVALAGRLARDPKNAKVLGAVDVCFAVVAERILGHS